MRIQVVRIMKNGNGAAVDLEDVEFEVPYKCHSVDASAQTSSITPYRLRFWPKFDKLCQCKTEENSVKKTVHSVGRIFTQLVLSQAGLLLVLVLWTILGAYAFYKTEGPRELEQNESLKNLQNELSVELEKELSKESEKPSVWSTIIHQFIEKHEGLLLEAVRQGFGEGGRGQIWIYPGCILFAISLLTTLGFGAPVPRTPLGRTSTVIFAAIGIPLHFLLILNMGSLGAVKFQNILSKNLSTLTPTDIQSKWIKLFPFVSVTVYYILGVVLFGVVRRRPPINCFMFPLDFTAAGGVATVDGYIRILYGLYLELAMTLAALIVSLVQTTAARGITELGLRLGLLVNH